LAELLAFLGVADRVVQGRPGVPDVGRSKAEPFERQVVAEELSGLDDIQDAYVFGSWAARYMGEGGRPPADVDVLVIGEPDRDTLDDAAQRAGERLAREVNVTVRSAQWWEHGTDGFHVEIRRRPLVPVFGQASGR